MICEVWYDPEDNSYTVFPTERRWKHIALMSKLAGRLHVIAAKDWTRIMTLHHQIMSWDPYIHYT